MLEERLNVLENEDYKIKTESEIKEEKVKVNKEKIKTYQDNRSQQEIYYSNLNKKQKQRDLQVETLLLLFFGWLSGLITALSVL
jgi:hypothetical protein